MSRPLLGSHQRCWIWGRRLLRETLRAGLWRPYALYLATENGPRDLASLAEDAGIPIHWETFARLKQRCGAGDHQGAIAKMPPFPYAESVDLLERPTPRLLVTDHLQDPFNFGAIIRVAACFGLTGVVVPKTGQVGVTSQVARSSAGAVNTIPISRTEDLPQTLRQWKQRGVRIVATVAEQGTPLPEADLCGPTALVIGNESSGISREIAALCDLGVTIPITGGVESLNAAVAAGIVLYEWMRGEGRN